MANQHASKDEYYLSKIRELRAELAALKEWSNPVNDPPEDGQLINYYWVTYNGSRGSSTGFAGSGVDMKTVKGWQPFPQLPEGEE